MCSSLACGLLVAAAGCDSEAPRRSVPRVTPSASTAPPEAGEPVVIEVALNYTDPGRQGRALYDLPYGDVEDRLGGAPVCLHEGCELPCPCSVPVAPAAFDVDDRGRLWVVDAAKGRIAVFGRDSRFLFSVTTGRNDYRVQDLQVVDGRPIALRQGDDFSAQVFEVIGRKPGVIRRVYGDGEALSGGSPLSVSQDELFTYLWEPVDEIGEPFGFARIDPLTGRRRALATSAEGVPFSTGTYVYPRYVGDRAAQVIVESVDDPHNLELRFRLLVPGLSKTEARKGVVSREVEVAPDGTLHLLLFAGTYGRDKQDGYWYLRIAPDGTVGRPVHLREPDSGPNDPGPNHQLRRLALDEDGEPLIMLAGPSGATVRRPPAPGSER